VCVYASALTCPQDNFSFAVHLPPLIVRKIYWTGVGNVQPKSEKEGETSSGDPDAKRDFFCQLAIIADKNIGKIWPEYITRLKLFLKRWAALRYRLQVRAKRVPTRFWFTYSLSLS
jgi:hypothetical protein